VVLIVRIGAELEQRADEGERTVMDRVFQDDLADALRSSAVRKMRGLAEQAHQRCEIASLVCVVERKRVTHTFVPSPPAAR